MEEQTPGMDVPSKPAWRGTGEHTDEFPGGARTDRRSARAKNDDSEALTPLSTEDAGILALETGPIRGHTLKVLVIEDSPGEGAVDALRAEIAQRLTALPRWRQRLVAAPNTPSGVAWRDDPDFDIARHVRAAFAEQTLDNAGFRRALAEIMEVPLERDRPLWTLDVLPRLTDDRWAIVWKVHHCLADGTAMIRAGGRLFWSEDPSPQQRAPRATRAAASTRTSTSTSSQFVAGARLAKAWGHRGLVIREFRRTRQLSRLAAEVGPDRAIDFAQCTISELKTLGKAIAPEVTVNDVLLAVVAGGLRRWLESLGVPYTRMKAQVPVSMHPHFAEDDPYGNRDSYLLLELPLGEPDPIARVRKVNHATRLRKNRHDAQAIYALRGTLSHAPARMQSALRHLVQGPTEYSLNISNVPGPAGSIRVLGHKVTSLYAFAEVAPHHALRVAAVSLSGVLFIGLCADLEAVPQLDVLARGIRLSVDELHERLGIA